MSEGGDEVLDRRGRNDHRSPVVLGEEREVDALLQSLESLIAPDVHAVLGLRGSWSAITAIPGAVRDRARPGASSSRLVGVVNLNDAHLHSE
jgi:hypothetical protein